MSELVSIIIPTHNRATLLCRAIDSVFAQTWIDWELIIVADNCIDETAQVVAGYLKDRRVRYEELEVNLGGAGARNYGMNLVRGTYVAFLDDDDEWLPAKLETQIVVFRRSNDFAIVSCNFEKISEYGVKRIVRMPLVSLDDLLLDNVIGSFSFCMTKKEYIDGIYINEKLSAYQDHDFWTKILLKSRLKCYRCQENLVKYYEHDEVRLTKQKRKVYDSSILYLRCYYTFMNSRQKYHNIYRLNIKKTDVLNLRGLTAFYLLFTSIINCTFNIKSIFKEAIRIIVISTSISDKVLLIARRILAG